MKHSFVYILILIGLLGMPRQVHAQNAQGYYQKAKFALEEGNAAGCLSYLERCEALLGGSNVRIASLKAQCYALQADWVNAKIALRNYENLPSSGGSGEVYDQLRELTQQINAGLEATEKEFHEKKKEEKAKNLRQAEAEIASMDRQKEEKLTRMTEKSTAVLYKAAMESRDKEALAMFKEQVGTNTKAGKKVEEELDKHKNPNKYILRSVADGDVRETEYLVGIGASVNHKNSSGQPLIQTAAENEDKSMMKSLKTLGADIELKNSEGETPLFAAIRAGKQSGAFELLQLGADAKTVLSNGVTTVHYAVYYKANFTLPLLLKRGADPNVKFSVDKIEMTPLYYTVYHLKSADMAGELMYYGARFNDFGKDNWTPLMAAIMNHDLNMVQLLMRYKADPNIKGPHGWTALHFAARENQPEIIVELLKNGANKKAQDEWKRTPRKIAYENELKPAMKALRKGRI